MKSFANKYKVILIHVKIKMWYNNKYLPIQVHLHMHLYLNPVVELEKK